MKSKRHSLHAFRAQAWECLRLPWSLERSRVEGTRKGAAQELIGATQERALPEILPPNARYSANPLRQAPPQGQSLPQPKYLNEFKPGGCWERLGAGVVREGITNVRAFA